MDEHDDVDDGACGATGAGTDEDGAAEIEGDESKDEEDDKIKALADDRHDDDTAEVDPSCALTTTGLLSSKVHARGGEAWRLTAGKRGGEVCVEDGTPGAGRGGEVEEAEDAEEDEVAGTAEAGEDDVDAKDDDGSAREEEAEVAGEETVDSEDTDAIVPSNEASDDDDDERVAEEREDNDDDDEDADADEDIMEGGIGGKGIESGRWECEGGGAWCVWPLLSSSLMSSL